MIGWKSRLMGQIEIFEKKKVKYRIVWYRKKITLYAGESPASC
jgi:hypothetical protein